MAIMSTAAKTASLKGDFGTSKSANAPATYFVAYFTDSGMATELTGTGGIARIAVTNVDANWSTTAGVTSNVTAITSATSTGAWGSTAGFVALMDAVTAGNAWDGGNLTSSVTVAAANTIVQIAIGQLTISA